MTAAISGTSAPRHDGARSDQPDISAPITANHLSSEPERMKMIGATQSDGSWMVVSISESPVGVAGKPCVVMLTVDTLLLPGTRQLTSARNWLSSLVPRSSGGTSGSLANTTPRTLAVR